ncbi:lipoic acid synthetase [Salmonella enterica subsp. enterica serovar Braenderup]|nr:lipoic acid synthetase [Salmonella enterica subsp. enterica serovar Braenderup]
MQELHDHGVTMLTLGQYLQPGPYHLPVQRYATPAEFEELRLIACEIGFTHATCGPLYAHLIMLNSSLMIELH